MASVNIDTARRNLERAENAHRALEAYGLPEQGPGDEVREVTFDEAHQVLGDLLCDLQHWADAHKVSWPGVLNRGNSHYAAEKRGE